MSKNENPVKRNPSNTFTNLCIRWLVGALIIVFAVNTASAKLGVNIVDVALGNGGLTQGLLNGINVITGGKVKHHRTTNPKAHKGHKSALVQGCQGHHHGPGCLAAAYVRSGRIYIPASDDLYDYRVATGALPAPATRVTPDGITTHYYVVNRPVWLSLVKMANSLNDRSCYRVKGKHHKKRQVCKTLLGAVEVTCLETCHPYYTSSDNISHHTVGEAVDVGAVRWRGTWHIINTAFQYSRLGKSLMWRITRACVQTGAAQAISLWDFGYGSHSIRLPDHYNHLHCGGYSWK